MIALAPKAGVPLWALAELQEDLETAAIDLGRAYGERGVDPDVFGRLTLAEERFSAASERLRKAIEAATEER